MDGGTLAAPLMWGRFTYPHPGKFLGTGNRCGHDPQKPHWDWFRVPDDWANPPAFIKKLLEGMRDYFGSPSMLPTLAHLSGKQNADGSLRRNRSEAREAECLVMQAILRQTDFSSLVVGTPVADGRIVYRSCGEIAKLAGLLAPNSDPARPEPSRRFWRAFKRLRLAGAFDVHTQYETLPDGSKRGRPAIKNLNPDFLVLIGRTTYKNLQAFQKARSEKVTADRQRWRQEHAELVAAQQDANIAGNRLRMQQALNGVQPAAASKSKKAKHAPAAPGMAELREQYGREQAALMGELCSKHPNEPPSWHFAEVRKRLPPFDDWVKKKLT